MATGRGWILRQHSLGFLRSPGPVVTHPSGKNADAMSSSVPGSASAKQSTTLALPLSKVKGMQIRSRHWKSAVKSNSSVNFDSMPSEILLKIFSYLDAQSLLCAGCVNKRFYHLSSDNSLWFKMYTSTFPPKRKKWTAKSVEEPTTPLSPPESQERESGYWKKEYILKNIAAIRSDIIQLLKPINTYTGLPLKMDKAIKFSGLRWVIILKDKNGKEHITDQSDISLNETSITISWYSVKWPCLEMLSTLQLCGVTPVLLNKGKVYKNGPWRRSLISEYDLANLSEKANMIGCDPFVQLYRFDQGLLVGLWKKNGIAFIMASLHHHQLIERSTLGTATVKHPEAQDKAILDDVDPEYGMHGYQLHIDLYSSGNTYMCSTFRSLFCTKDYIRNGYLRLSVISYKNNAQHLPLVGNVGLSWRVDAFEGNVKNCFIMDVTVLDYSQKPFWCVSAPVYMILSAKPSVLYQYLGPSYVVKYVDSTGKVHMELVWMEETNEYYVVNLVLYLSTRKVNSWFGTNY
uniref:F-box only protein 15 isoform X1 n=1 Tax=Pogona vitticeps TaxID=103695 RepID=A0A6J0UH85_9SAUR